MRPTANADEVRGEQMGRTERLGVKPRSWLRKSTSGRLNKCKKWKGPVHLNEAFLLRTATRPAARDRSIRNCPIPDPCGIDAETKVPAACAGMYALQSEELLLNGVRHELVEGGPGLGRGKRSLSVEVGSDADVE